MREVSVSRRKQRVGFKGIVNSTDKSLLGWEYSPEAYNFVFRDGLLTGEIGLDAGRGFRFDRPDSRWDLPALPEDCEGITKMFHYRRSGGDGFNDRLLVQTPSGRFYYVTLFLQDDAWHEIEGLTAVYPATAVNYKYGDKDILLLSGEDLPLTMLDDVAVSKIENAPRFTSLTVHGERVFGVCDGARGRVWFSDNMNPTDWSVSSETGGYIDFADEWGATTRVVSFLSYLYIFREHGIYRLTAYGDQTDFVLKKMFTSAGRIYENTIALCGDRILFLDDEGIKTFDGYDVSRVDVPLPELVFKQNCKAAYSGDSYFLAALANIERRYDPDGYFDCNLIVRYDLGEKETAFLAGYDVRDMTTLRAHGADVVAVASYTKGLRHTLAMTSASGEAYGTPTYKLYRSPYNTLSYEGIKVVRDVTLTVTEGEIVFRLLADGATVFEHTFVASEEPQTVFVGKSGRRIGIEIVSESAAVEVSPPTLNIDFVR